jgi:tetratricopeptide (TPR) repeat protein
VSRSADVALHRAERLRERGVVACGRRQWTEAAALLTAALADIPNPATDPSSLRLELGLRTDLKRPLIRQGRLYEARAHLELAEATARILGDQASLVLIESAKAHVHWLAGDLERAVCSARAALARMGDSADGDELSVLTWFRLGKALHSAGRYAQAREAFDRAAAQLRGRDLEIPAIRGHPAAIIEAWLGWTCGELGALRAGIRHARAARRRAARRCDDYALAFADHCLGTLLLNKGEPQSAMRYLHEARWKLAPIGSQVLEPRLLSSLGLAYLHQGWSDQGLAMLRQAAARGRCLRSGGPSGWLSRLAEGLVAVGQVEEAVVAATQARDQATRQNELGYEAWSRYTLALAHARCSAEVTSVVPELLRARHLGRTLGMRPLVAYCDFTLGCADAAAGNGSSMRRRVNRARADFASMGMRRAAAECEASLLRVG